MWEWVATVSTQKASPFDKFLLALSSKSRDNLGIVDCLASYSIPVYPGALIGISRRLLGSVCEVHDMDKAFVEYYHGGSFNILLEPDGDFDNGRKLRHSRDFNGTDVT